MNEIVVQSVYETDDGVVVMFNDGHRCLFTPLRQTPISQTEGLKEVTMFNADGHIIFHYYGSLYTQGTGIYERKITILAWPYTQQRIALYWDAACEYLTKRHREENNQDDSTSWFPWDLICTEGASYLALLRDGNAEFVR